MSVNEHGTYDAIILRLIYNYIERELKVVPNLFPWRAVTAERIYAKDDMMNARHLFHFSVQPSWLKNVDLRYLIDLLGSYL